MLVPSDNKSVDLTDKQKDFLDALFGEDPSTAGVLELMGNTIEYTVSPDGTMITLKITDAEGNVTEITVPIGSFTF